MTARARALGLVALVVACAVPPPAASAQTLAVPPVAAVSEDVQGLVQTTRAEVGALVPPAVASVVPEPAARLVAPARGGGSRAPSPEDGRISGGVAREAQAPTPATRSDPRVPKPRPQSQGGRNVRAVAAAPTPASRGRDARRGVAAPPPEARENTQLPHVAIDLVEILPPALLALLIALVASSLLATSGSLVSEARARGLRRERSVLLDDAGVLQRALVPDVPERVGPLAVSVGFRPADGPAAGGDFYDVVPLSGGRVAVLVGDVVGHGREAVAHAALVRHTLRAWLELGLSPGSVLRLAAHGRVNDSKDEMATAIVAVYDACEGTLSYACAGHPEPLVPGSHPGERFHVPCVSGPLGVDLPTGRRTTTISLPPGAVACLYTDGVVEARTTEGLFGSDRLLELIERGGADATADELLDVVARESERTPDDMAICILRPLVGSREPSGQVEELEISSDEIQAAEDFLADCGVPVKARLALTAAAAGDALATGRAFLRVSWPHGKPHAELLSPSSEPHWLSEALASPR